MDPMDPSISFDDDEGDNLGYNSEVELLEHDGDTCGINEVLVVTSSPIATTPVATPLADPRPLSPLTSQSPNSTRAEEAAPHELTEENAHYDLPIA
jgi:hypothetical protein